MPEPGFHWFDFVKQEAPMVASLAVLMLALCGLAIFSLQPYGWLRQRVEKIAWVGVHRLVRAVFILLVCVWIAILVGIFPT